VVLNPSRSNAHDGLPRNHSVSVAVTACAGAANCPHRACPQTVVFGESVGSGSCALQTEYDLPGAANHSQKFFCPSLLPSKEDPFWEGKVPLLGPGAAQ